MSWNVYDKVLAEERMQRLKEGAQLPPLPVPEPIKLTMELRQRVIGEIQEHIKASMPADYCWIVQMALLHYGCLALTNQPEAE